MTRWSRLAIVVFFSGVAAGCGDGSVKEATIAAAPRSQTVPPGADPVPVDTTPATSTIPIENQSGVTGSAEPAPGPSPRAEGWEMLPPSPLSARSGAITAWTGKELLIWRGRGYFSDACTVGPGGEGLCGEPARNDGAALDLAAGTWRPLPAGPLPEIKGSDLNARGVWTGTELVIWGLSEGVGAAYDPDSDTWRSLPPAPLAPRGRFSMAWTGSEVVVVGGSAYQAWGFSGGGALLDGAAWNPVSGDWRRLPDLPAPRSGATLAALGDSLYLVGGNSGNQPTLDMVALVGEGTAWAPRAPSPGTSLSTYVVAGNAIVEVAPAGGPFYEYPPPASTSRYDLVTDAWEPLAPIPIDRSFPGDVVWTGRELIVLGGAEPAQEPDPTQTVGAALHLATGVWRELPAAPLDDLSMRTGMALAWTGAEVLAWGGELNFGLGSRVLDGGVRYDPGR